MRLKIFVTIFLLVVLSSFISATSDQWDVGVLFWYTGDDVDTVGTIAVDITNTSNGTLTGGLLAGQSCLFNECYFYDGINDFLDIPTNNPTSAFTYNAWVKAFDLNDGRTIIMDDGGWTGMSSGKSLVSGTSNKWNAQIYDTDTRLVESTTALNTGWEMITLVWGLDNVMRLYINGTEEDTNSNNDPGGSNQLTIGSFNQGVSNFFKGYIDEISAYSRAWNSTEVMDAFIQGNPFNFTPPVFGLNESLENSFQDQQVGSVNINSVAFLDVLSSSFNSSQNTTSYYGVTISLSSGGASVSECRVLVDGVDFNSSVIRTLGVGDVASVYLTTSDVSISDGNHTFQVQCRRVSGGSYVVSNTIIVGHLLFDENLNNLVQETIVLDESVLNGSFEVLDSIIFNTSDLTPDGVHNSTIIINWDGNYNYATTSNISTFIKIGVNNCSSYPRGGVAGSSGVVGGDCVLNNAGFNNSYNISVFGTGSGNISGNFHIKEFVVDFGEVKATGLNNTNIGSSSLTEIATIVFNVTDHASIDIFVKAGIPHQSNSGSTSSNFMLQLNGTINSSVISRDVDTVIGVTIIQFLFSGISSGLHNISLLASCDNANCSVVGGDLMAYVSNEITVVTSQVNISAFDVYDDSSILVFNVTDSGGNVFSTSSGSVFASSVNPLEDYIIRSSGFFTNIVLGHNTSSDLNVSLKQSVISFQAFKKVSNASISSFSVTDGTIINVTTGGVATLFLQVGDFQNITFFSSGSFFNQTISINVSALDNKSFNFTGLFDAQLNLTAFNATPGSLLSNLSGNVVFGVFNESFSTTGSNIVLNLTKGLDLSVYLTSRPNHTSAHAGNFQTINLSSNFTNVNFSLFRDQSIAISFNDILTGIGLDDVMVFLFGSTNFNFTVDSSGFVFPFPVDNYNLLASKTGFSSFSTTISIVEGGLINISAFMNNDTSEVSFIVRDISGGFIEGAAVSVTRSSDGALIGSRSTDIFGAVVFGLNEDIAYNINVTKLGFLPFFGSLNAFQSSYTITLSTASANQQFFIGLSYQFLPTNSEFLSNDTLTNFSFNISSNGFWDLSSCSFELLNGSFDGSVLASNSSFCSVTGGFASIVFNTSSFDLLVGKATFFLNGSDSVSVFRFYSVNDDFQGEFSLMTFFDDILNFDKAGFTSVSLFFLTVFMIVGVTVTLGSQLNVFGEPEKMLLFATVLVGAASFVGLLTVDFAPSAFPAAGQWIIFTFMGLLTIASIISSGNWRLS